MIKLTKPREIEAVIQMGQTSDVRESFLNIHVPFSEVRWQQSAQICGTPWALSPDDLVYHPWLTILSLRKDVATDRRLFSVCNTATALPEM